MKNISMLIAPVSDARRVSRNKWQYTIDEQIACPMETAFPWYDPETNQGVGLISVYEVHTTSLSTTLFFELIDLQDANKAVCKAIATIYRYMTGGNGAASGYKMQNTSGIDAVTRMMVGDDVNILRRHRPYPGREIDDDWD